MPVGSSNAEDLASSDEIKVFKDEGEDEKRASADLTDLKSSLITESDQEKSSSRTFAGNNKTTNNNNTSQQQQTSSNNLQNGQRPESTSSFSGKPFESTLGGYSPFGYPLHPHSPYHPHNGTTTLGQMANKVASMVGASTHPHSGSHHSLPFMMPPNMESRLPQPPPAHMGIPPVHIETKSVSISAWMDFDIANIARNPLYNLSGHGQYSHSVLSDLTQQFQWTNPAMYQLQSAAFRSPYASPLTSAVSSGAFPSFVRTPPIMPHPSLSGHHHSSFTHPSFLSSTASNSINNIVNDSNHNNSNSNHSTTNSSKSNRLNNGKNSTFNGTSPTPVTPSNRIMTNGSSSNNTSANNTNNHNNNNHRSRNNNSNSSSSIENNFVKIKIENDTDNNSTGIPRHCVINGTGSGKLVKNSNPSSTNKNSVQTPTTTISQQHQQQQQQQQEERELNRMHIKKPLNAFMIYMKEMRAKVIAESTLKESAAINQILGKRWHSLSRAEQEKYYDKARKERELHMEMHPGWTAKDNYAINGKRKKKKRERNVDGERGALKKCRARYGLDQQNHWCKPCRRKKKCIRYLEAARAAAAAAAVAAASTNGNNKSRSENYTDNYGSVEARTPESNKSTNESDHDTNTMNHLLSSATTTSSLSNDLSLSSPSNSEYHHFMNTFNPHHPHHHNPFSSSSAINSPTNHLNLTNNNNVSGGGGGHHLQSPSPSSLFYAHHHNSSASNHSLSSPLGSRVSSLLTPNSPLTSNISSSSSSSSNNNCYSSSSSVSSLVTSSIPTTVIMSNPNHQVPPRNSPFSIEQLARPHCPQSHRSSPLLSTTSINNNTITGGTSKTNNSVSMAVAQLPTPPSSADSTSATPAMLSVA